MNFDELYPGRFLKAGLIPNGKANYTIKTVAKEQIEGERGLEDKVVMGFEETALQLVLPKVNAVAIRAMFGSDVQQWIGKRVTLFPDTWNGEPCIRIWGSPDIERDIEVEIALPRRRPFKKTMHVVTKGKPSSEAGAEQAQTEAATI